MVIAGGAALAFGWRTLDAGFLMGDDQRFVTDHFLVNHPSLANAWILLTVPHGDLYQPLPMLSFQLDYALASQTPTGVAPFAFHLTNVFLHVLNSMLVVLLAAALSRRIVIGGLVGLLFATHPMAMESVAWVSGRMILLATLFSLVVLILAVRRRRTPGRGWAISIWLAWIAALISKVMPTIPLVAWLFDRKVHRDADRRGLWTYVALFVIGVIAVGAMSTLTHAEGFGTQTMMNVSTSAKSLILATGTYMDQYVVPTRLSPWTPPVTDVAWSDGRVLSALAKIGVVLGLVLLLRRRLPLVAAGLAVFLLLLAPFLLASLARRLFVANRYMYLPMVGLHLAVVCGLARLGGLLARGRPRDDRRALPGTRFAAAPILLLACWWLYLGMQLAPAWSSTIAYAKRIVACFPDKPDAYNELARAYLFSDRPNDALATAKDAAARWPDNPRLLMQLGEAWSRLGDNVNALIAFDKALSAAPNHTRIRYLRAVALLGLGRTDEAKKELTRLIGEQPKFLPAYSALAKIYRSEGDDADLRATLTMALRINPYHRDNLFDLAMLDYKEDRLDDAERALRKLTELNPNDLPALLNLGAVLAKQGRDIDAVKCYDKLLARNPRETAARFNRGDLLVALGQPDDAEQDYRAILKFDPGNLDAATRLHKLLVADQGWPVLLSLWSDVRSAVPDNPEVACYSGWARMLAAIGRHAPLPVTDDTVPNDCAGWIDTYERLRAKDWTGLGASLDRLPLVQASRDQIERRRRVIMSAFEALPVDVRNSRPGLYVAARLLHYFGDDSNSVRFLDLLRDGSDDWAARSKALLDRLKQTSPT